MKKKMMVLGGLLMAVAITGYSVSGTYAKYISALDTITDSARVAKWSFQLKDAAGNKFDKTSTTVDLFKDSYLTNVVASDKTADAPGSKIIAPGTEGKYTFQVYGTAETMFKVTLTANGEITNDIDGNLAKKLKFGVKNTKDATFAEADYTMTFAELKAHLATLYNGTTKYAANTVLGADDTKDMYTIGWMWDFHAGDDTETDETNATDTALGEASALGTSVPSVELSIDIVVEQVQA